MRMASLLLSVPVLIQAVIPVAAWWRKYLRKALASADSGFVAAGLAAGWAGGGRGGGVGGEGRGGGDGAEHGGGDGRGEREPLHCGAEILVLHDCPRLLSRPDDLRIRARGCGTGARTVAARWQRKTAGCARVAGVPQP